MKGLWFSVWAVSCMSLGLFMAYVDGASPQGLIASAMVWSTVIAAVIASIFVFNLLKRKRSPQSQKPHQPAGQQEAREEAMSAANLKAAVMMVGGAGIGYLIGSAVFTELYALIGSGIIGCAASPAITMWRNRRIRGPRGKQ